MPLQRRPRTSSLLALLAVFALPALVYAFAVTKVTITPTPRTVANVSTPAIPISGKGVSDTENGIATFTYVFDTKGTLQHKLNSAATDTTVSPIDAEAGTELTFTISFNSPNIKPDVNSLAVTFKPTGGTASAVTNFTVFVDQIPPPAPTGLRAEGLDKAVSVSWDAPGTSGIEVIDHYLVYFSTTDFAGMTTAEALKEKSKSFKDTKGNITGLANDTTYFLTIRAVDWVDNASSFPTDSTGKILSVKAEPVHTLTLSELAGEDGGCFIATAAYSSYEEPHVKILRQFRDKILASSDPGRMFIAWYYENSPAWAAKIARSETARAVVRVALLPLIAFAYAALSPAWSAGAACLTLLAVIAALVRRRRSLLEQEIA